MSRVTLRPYQESAVDGLRESYRRGKRAPLLVLPTGAGKTVVFSYITSGTAAKSKRVLVVAHRVELLKQASKKLSDAGVEHGIIAPGFTRTRDAVQVASIQSISRKPGAFGMFDLIIIDEAHHSVAGQYVKLIAAQPQAKLLGVTATPERGDGRGLGITAGGVFDDIVVGPTVRELIEGGYLVKSRVFAPATGPDLSGVKIRMGEYAADDLAAAMAKPSITGEATTHYAKYAPGKPSIVFCVSVDHAKVTAATFRSAGWRAVAVDGSTPAPERDAAIGGLSNGSVQVLCTCSLVDEGLDVTSVSAVILLAPTKSLGRHMQRVGRGLRPEAGKEHLILLDHAGSTLLHGLPDEDRAWSLEGRPKKEVASATKQCKKCFAIYSPRPVCPECGHSTEAEDKAARELEVIAGELAEIDAERLASIRKTPLAKLLTGHETLPELLEIQKTKGYKTGWAFHVMRERRMRRAA